LTLSKGTSLYSVILAPGDYDGDHAVSAADYALWRKAVGSTTDLRADGNGNGVIDGGDFDIWRSHFGMTYAIGAGLAASVPEPSSFAMILFGMCGALLGRQTRSSLSACLTNRRKTPAYHA